LGSRQNWGLTDGFSSCFSPIHFSHYKRTDQLTTNNKSSLFNPQSKQMPYTTTTPPPPHPHIRRRVKLGRFFKRSSYNLFGSGADEAKRISQKMFPPPLSPHPTKYQFLFTSSLGNRVSSVGWFLPFMKNQRFRFFL
jgi:hypothetical protein